LRKRALKILLALSLAAVFAAPNTALAADAGSFRFLFPPSNQFDNVIDKLADGYYLVTTHGDDDGYWNVCNQSGQLVSDTNFDRVLMVLGDKLYVSLETNRLAIIDMAARTARKFDYQAVTDMLGVYNAYGVILTYSPENGAAGIADMDGDYIVPPTTHSFIKPIGNSENYIAMDYKNKGVIDKTGKAIIPIIYKEMDVSAPGEVMAKNPSDEWGVLDSGTGEIIVPFEKRGFDLDIDLNDLSWPCYGPLRGFVNGRLFRAAIRDGKLGLIDNRLNIAVPCEYDGLTMQTNGEAIVAWKDASCGMLAISGGEILPFEYNNIAPLEYAGPRHEPVGVRAPANFYAISTDGLYHGLYDTNRGELLPQEYIDISAIGGSRLLFKLTDADGKQGLADLDGNILTPKFFDSIDYSYPNDAYLANDAGHFAIYTGEGKLAYNIKGAYDRIDFFNVYTKRAFVMRKKNNGTASVYKYGLVDLDGNILIPAEYTLHGLDITALTDYPHVFSLDISQAEKDSKWGVLDSEGNVVIPFTLEEKASGKGYASIPYLKYDAETGQPASLTYGVNGEVFPPSQFVVHSFKGTEYYGEYLNGSYFGKGAVLIRDQD